MSELQNDIQSLNQQLLAAAKAFSEDAEGLSVLLNRFVQDVERVMAEPLDIFPVAHHSPASALHMVRRLQEKPPKVIYMEMCEDMLPLVENLHDCRLPVALQAFAATSETLPQDALPVSVVAPLTEASAEYQAIAYTLTHPETQLVFVDRAVDYVFQWDKEWQEKIAALEAKDDEAERENAKLHGTSVALSLGDMLPSFELFLEFLLRNARTKHFAEWWEQYVERAIISADYQAYRQVMTLIGSLMRNLGRKTEDKEQDLLRERYMWTRMKQHMKANNIQPEEAMYICGAAHTGSEVDEFGTGNELVWDIPERSKTNWLYGIIPSSYAAIEHQFSHPAGTVSLAEATWEKSLKAAELRPFNLKNAERKFTPLKAITKIPRALAAFLTQAPEYANADNEQLLEWCVRIVALARNNGYLASTADSIAIYETSILLAHMRNRHHPSPYDFSDAAITCLEKDITPRKRNIARLCQILLGGDRYGTVGYKSLPPLAQNIYDRLAPLGVNLFAKTNQRALMDFKANPEKRDCSNLLWKLNYLLGNQVAEPIVGEHVLGQVAIQESWDVKIGKVQGQVIQLGYEGVTLEHVMEQRMKAAAFAEDSSAAKALHIAEDALLFMGTPRLVRELGSHSVYLLKQETSADSAPEIFSRARRLVHYYRSTPDGLPDWLQNLVSTGYSHYAAMLPKAFGDAGTKPEQIAGMLSFIFTLESLALSLGCQRSQLLLGLQGAAQEQIPPDKIGLLWTSEWFLKLKTLNEMRELIQHVLDDALRLPKLPQYLNGFILSLGFAPKIASFITELLSQIFASVPDQTMIGWMPGLMIQLREHQAILKPLIKEAATVFPQNLAGFQNWQPRWLEDKPLDAPKQAFNAKEGRLRALLSPEPINALAAWLELEETWETEEKSPIQTLIEANPSTEALSRWISKISS